uniref:Nif11-type n=1 Tax=Nostoc sp. PCC 9448 TaxID=2099384 RepID=A0A2P0ZGG0_9NOSO|nr:Nif11-type precursor [Nostoc sp. PCC 9448]
MTIAILDRPRFLLVVLCSNRWFLKALRRTIFPLPVARNRFAAALRVLSLGMDGLQFDTIPHYILCLAIGDWGVVINQVN